jgi:hypothetical protein
MTPDRGTEVVYTAPNGTSFQAVVVNGRLEDDGLLAIRHKADGRLVFANPDFLEKVVVPENEL